MSLIESLALGVTLAAIFLGLIGAMVLVGQRPSFWIGMVVAVFAKSWPSIKTYVTKRMPPEDEEAWRKCQLRGGKWNHRKRRCE